MRPMPRSWPMAPDEAHPCARPRRHASSTTSGWARCGERRRAVRAQRASAEYAAGRENKRTLCPSSVHSGCSGVQARCVDGGTASAEKLRAHSLSRLGAVPRPFPLVPTATNWFPLGSRWPRRSLPSPCTRCSSLPLCSSQRPTPLGRRSCCPLHRRSRSRPPRPALARGSVGRVPK